MKVPISQHAVIDLDAPVLPAYEVRSKAGVRWVVWCKHCREWLGMGPLKATGRLIATIRRARIGRPGIILPMRGNGNASDDEGGDVVLQIPGDRR